MKKLIVSMLTGALILGGTVSSVSAAATADGKTNVGYTSGAITDPENPSNPTWSVSIPKDFVFTDGNLTKNVDVTLNVLDEMNTPFPSTDKVQVDVASKNTYKLTTTGATVSELSYELKYGSIINTDGRIGDLTADAKTIGGNATLEATQLTNVGVDGTYKDVLTYTVHAAVAK